MPRLTPSQQSAVEYLEGDSLIIATAGAGKTRVLVEKAARLLEARPPPEKTIAVVTFTEKAAKELEERIKGRIGASADSSRRIPLQIGTIHSLAASLLRSYGEKIGIKTDFSVMDGPLASLELEKTVREGLLNFVESKDPEAMEAVGEFGFRPSVGLLQSLIREGKGERSPHAGLVKKLRERYTSEKRTKNLLDFNDLEALLLKLLDDPQEAIRCQGSFSWILVDEFQDTSPAQWEILLRLHDPGRNRLVIVGDPRQSIYRFRGADPAVLEKAKPLFEKSGRIFFLNENFRSDPGVIELINRITAPLFGDFYEPLVAVKRGLNRPGYEVLPLPAVKGIDPLREIEAKKVAARLQTMAGEGIRWGEMALLFRARTAVPIFEREFQAAGIPCETRAGESLLEKKETLPLLLLLRCLAKDEDKIAAFGLGRSRLSPLLKELHSLRPGLENPASLQDGILPYFPDEVERTNVVLFFKLLGRLKEIGIRTAAGWVESLESLRKEKMPISAAERLSSKKAVQMLTIHGAKGLEFRVVVLADLGARRTGGRGLYVPDSGGEILLKEKDGETIGLRGGLKKSEAFERAEARERDLETEESKRLLYVALTRAIERIIFPLETGKEKPSGEMARWIYHHVLG